MIGYIRAMKNWRLCAAALSLSGSLSLLTTAAQASDRQDGTTGTTLNVDPSGDIVDLFAWMEPIQGQRLQLVLTVFPNADKTTSRFSNQTVYVIHTAARASATDPNPAPEVPIVCRFNNQIPQEFECLVGQVDYIRAAVGTSGNVSSSGKFQVFAGPRNDPFFMNTSGTSNAISNIASTVKSGARDAQGCHAFSTLEQVTVRQMLNPIPSMDSYRTQHVLGISISVDKSLLIQPGKTMLSVWASTNTAL